MGGAIFDGYDPNQIYYLIEVFKIPDHEKLDIIDKISIMENVTLNKVNS